MKPRAALLIALALLSLPGCKTGNAERQRQAAEQRRTVAQKVFRDSQERLTFFNTAIENELRSKSSDPRLIPHMQKLRAGEMDLQKDLASYSSLVEAGKISRIPDAIFTVAMTNSAAREWFFTLEIRMYDSALASNRISAETCQQMQGLFVRLRDTEAFLQDALSICLTAKADLARRAAEAEAQKKAREIAERNEPGFFATLLAARAASRQQQGPAFYLISHEQPVTIHPDTANPLTHRVSSYSDGHGNTYYPNGNTLTDSHGRTYFPSGPNTYTTR